MKTTTVIMLWMSLASGLLIGTLLFDHQQQASAQMGMGMMNPNMMNRTAMMGSMMNPNMMNNMMMNPNMMGMMNPNMMGMGNMMGMMNPGMMNNMMMNPMMGNMMMNPDMMGMGNMMNMMFGGQNITSSVRLLPSMMNGISSQVKVSLGDAVMTAQKELGNSSHAVAAHIGDERGFLIYRILGIDPDMNLHQIIIDPGNGKVLLSQKLPMSQMMGNMMNPMMGNMMNPMMGNMMNPMMGNMMGMSPNMMGHFWH